MQFRSCQAQQKYIEDPPNATGSNTSAEPTIGMGTVARMKRILYIIDDLPIDFPINIMHLEFVYADSKIL